MTNLNQYSQSFIDAALADYETDTANVTEGSAVSEPQLHPIYVPAIKESATNDLYALQRVKHIFRFGMTIVPMSESLPPKTAILVMMNPGNAGQPDIPTDDTVELIYPQLKDSFKRIIIVNTVPVYEGSAKKLGQKLESVADASDVWGPDNLETIKAYLDVLEAHDEFYEVLIGTGDLKPYNRKYFHDIMDLFPDYVRKNHLYAADLNKPHDGAHPKPQVGELDISRANWKQVHLVEKTINHDLTYKLKYAFESADY